MVLADGRVESCGNFHGAPVAHVCDFLAIAAADVGAIAERRTDRLLDATRSHGLPPFLAAEPGIDSGMMLAHYSQAAIVAENRRQAMPASVDSLPTSAMQEDHVSMGWGAARKLRVAVTDYAGCSPSSSLRRPGAGPAGAVAAWRRDGAALACVRSSGPGTGPDRFVAPELAAVSGLARVRGAARAGPAVRSGGVGRRAVRSDGTRGLAVRQRGRPERAARNRAEYLLETLTHHAGYSALKRSRPSR